MNHEGALVPNLGPRFATPTRVRSLDDVLRVAEVLSSSGYFADVKDRAQAAVKVLWGLALGVDPVTAVLSIHVIEGKPALSANLIAARIRQSGRYDYRIREHDASRCTVEVLARTTEGWRSLGAVTWTLEDAKRAGLLGRSSWTRYPRQMLFARAISEAARTFCPDLFGGAPIYASEEAGSEEGIEVATVTVDSAVAPAEPPGITAGHTDLPATAEQEAEIEALLARAPADVAAIARRRIGNRRRAGRWTLAAADAAIAYLRARIDADADAATEVE